MRVALVVAFSLVFAATTTKAGSPDSEADFASLVERYFNAMTNGDGDAIRSVFHADAQLFGRFAGEPVVIPLTAWIERIEGDPKPAADALISPTPEDGIEWRLLAAERNGSIARLTVRDRFLGVWYTDYLTLLNTGGAWRIVNKTFTYETR